MVTSPFRKIAGFLGLAVVLAGCAVPAAYAPRRPGDATGYTDRELAQDRYRVTFTGNSATPRETVENYLLLRAAEVTLAAGGTHFVFDTRDTHARTTTHANGFGGGPYFGGGFGGGFYGRGFYGGWDFRPRWGYSAFGPPLMITQTTRYDAYAEIIVLKPGQERSDDRAVDAREIIAHLGPGAAAAPADHA